MMIRYLQGTVFEATEKAIIVMTSGGVGYHVTPAGALLASAAKNKPLSCYICTIVKENELSLYGFASSDELQLFEKLISVSGIGPKTALGMVSIPVGQFLSAVDNGDVAFLTKIPGLGKKTAERLIVELRGKIDLSSEETSRPSSPAQEEALQALENLGYDQATIQKVLKEAPESSSAEDLVKYFLSSNA